MVRNKWKNVKTALKLPANSKIIYFGADQIDGLIYYSYGGISIPLLTCYKLLVVAADIKCLNIGV